MPGLFDMHAHLLSGGFDTLTQETDLFDPATEQKALMQMLYWGVTAVCNLVQPMDTARELGRLRSAEHCIGAVRRGEHPYRLLPRALIQDGKSPRHPRTARSILMTIEII
jgi:imidazolonepropionase-like amidohydrolase